MTSKNKTICRVLLLALSINQTVFAKTEIREESYQYRGEKIQYQTRPTFLITSEPKLGPQPCNGSTGLVTRGTLGGRIAVNTCTLPVPHFQLDSAELTPREVSLIRYGVASCHLDKNSPVNVTGHTCILGTESYNYKLSHRRAEAVANQLRHLGYKIGEVTGKGSAEPVAEKDHLELNRRVVISQ